jgi:hypothetical protein
MKAQTHSRLRFIRCGEPALPNFLLVVLKGLLTKY